MNEVKWSQLDSDRNGSVDYYEFKTALDIALDKFDLAIPKIGLAKDQVISNGNAISRKDYIPLADKNMTS